jgi:hypothetical protein
MNLNVKWCLMLLYEFSVALLLLLYILDFSISQLRVYQILDFL